MTDKQARPPCYVLGIETQIGLSLIRELGEAGVPVVGIATDEHAIGLVSGDDMLVRDLTLESTRV